MSETELKKEEEVKEENSVKETEVKKDLPEKTEDKKTFSQNNRNKREFKKNRRQTRRPQQRQEFDQRILAIRRVTRVSAGGRRFSFSVAMAIGNGKGKIGVGTGKAGDTALAIEKAVKNAKKNIIEINHTNTMSIPHGVEAKYSSAQVKIQPSPGRGIVAGSAIRDMLELAGINDIVGKIISGSKNKLNIARATVQALDSLNSPKSHQAPSPKEGKKVSNKDSK